MDNAWIIAFYKETDPVKRLELLKANTGDGESRKTNTGNSYGLQDMENEHP